MSLCLEGLDRGAGVVEEEEEELVVMEAARVMGTWGSVTVAMVGTLLEIHSRNSHNQSNTKEPSDRR